MLARTTHPSRISRQARSSPRTLRRQMGSLRRDMDVFEQQFSMWKQSRAGRDRQAEVRFHIIEAQLARLVGSDTMETAGFRPVAPAMISQPIVYSIAAYRN